MKRILPSLVLSVALAFAGAVTAAAQSGKAASKAPAATAAQPAQKKLVKVVTLNSPAAVRAFQHDVQVMQAQRQVVLELKAALDKESNPQKKKDLKQRYDAALAKLETDNAAMTKGYGFSLARNYTMEVESASIYMEVTDEEAARVVEAAKKAEAEQAQKAKK